MNIQTIKPLILSNKGSNLSAVIQKDLKLRKPYKEDYKVTKITRLVIRGGIAYDNIGVVQEGRENGTLPAENAGLPWGEWADESGVHITHKGNDYVRMYPASGIDFPTKVTYLLNGIETSKSEVEYMCLASELPKPDDEEPKCFTIKADNIVEIGGLQ
jgi:hypothetical protein